MEGYIDSIEAAVELFPFAVALISIPYFYYQYKKYGRIELRKSILTFTFLLYIICCYCLTILPIPTYEEVVAIPGPYTDTRFFGFVSDYLNLSGVTANPATWLSSLESAWFYMPFFNFLMLVPFGIYQKRLFKHSLVTNLWYALLLSMSFELIQLSGLFGFFPHPYRTFQVDDMLLNVLGAFFGWIITPKSNEQRVEGKTGSRFSPRLKGRIITFILDLIILSIVLHLDSIIFGFSVIGGSITTQYLHYLIIGTLYFIVLSWFLGQRTPAQYLFDYSYRSRTGTKIGLRPFILRQTCYFGIVLPLPLLALSLFQSNYFRIITIPVGIICLLIPVVSIIQVSLNLPPFYESFSGVYLTDNRKHERITRDRSV